MCLSPPFASHLRARFVVFPFRRLLSQHFSRYIGIFFPLWIVALIPIRKKLFPMLLPEADLSNHLDCEDENQLETPLDRYPYPGE